MAVSPALADMKVLVHRHGWAVRHVLADAMSARAAFSYTAGLAARGWPELIITGLPAEVADAFIKNAVEVQAATGPFRAGDRSNELTDSGEVLFIAADDVSGMTATSEIIGAFSALQLVWPDSAGCFPWDADYRNSSASQPLLGTAGSDSSTG